MSRWFELEVSRMSKRKTKKMLRVAVAAAFVAVVALPATALAIPLNDSSATDSPCAMDPRLVAVSPEACSGNPQLTTNEQPVTSDAPVTSTSNGFEYIWLLAAITLAVGGTAGLIYVSRHHGSTRTAH
jgi:hypothetical protein